MKLHVLLLSSILLVLPAAPAAAQGVSTCGDLWNAYGPYDYRTDRDRLGIVERFHFTPQVETLIRGKSGHIGGDLDYTLRAFPNHHRALISMMRYAERLKTDQPPRAGYTVDCYFDRALRFRPNDHVARMIFASHLAKTGRGPLALQHLEIAKRSVQDSPLSIYNIGLVYFDLKEYDKALEMAHQALALDLPRTELKDRLKSVGRWVEPEQKP